MRRIIKHAMCMVAGAVALAAVAVQPAQAQNMPSTKSGVAMGGLTTVRAVGASRAETPWQTILTTQIKTAEQKDLAFDMALQCGLVTDTTVKSRGGNKSTSNASASIRVRIKVTDDEGNVSYALPSNDAWVDTIFQPELDEDGPMGVTYCERQQLLEAEFAGLNCTADLVTGEVYCDDPESLRLLLRTLNANAFNFLLADVTSGIHTIDVQVKAIADEEVFAVEGEPLGSANAEAFVGLGSLFVDEVRLVKGAVITQ